MGVDLYKYYPTFVKLKDRLASGIDDADSRETVLAKLVYMLDQMFDDTDAFIRLLLDLNDPDHVDQQYFSHVSYLLGTMLPNGSNEEETRFIIKQLVNHYKTSGTHPSWQTAWHWSDQPESKVVELFKRDQQEVANYSTVRSANHPLKSARIQLGVCASSCESVCVNTCESVCESIVEIGSEVPVSEALRRLTYAEYLRPIHVLLRQDAEEVLLSSGFPTTQETIGHYPEVYGVTPDPWLGSQVEGDFRNPFFSTGDELDVEVQCVALCEVSCQSCCEAVCECDPCEVVCQSGGCELQCTAGCQGFCEFPCEGACQFACTACQAGACTAACAGGCVGACEGACESTCQIFVCESGSCQGACTDTTCETQYCETNTCQDSCTGPNTMVCGSQCQGACTVGADMTCGSQCQSSCTTWSAMSCGSSCQSSCTTWGVMTCASACMSSCTTWGVMSCASQCMSSCVSWSVMTCASQCEGACTIAGCTATNCEIGSCQGTCASDCQASCTGQYCELSNCQGGACQNSYCMILTQ